MAMTAKASATAILLLHKALQVEPFGEAVDPVIRRQVLLAHAEAVAALCEHVQFDGFVSGASFFVPKNATECEAELIVGCRDKHRRCIRWYGRVFESCGGRVDRGYERGSPFRCVLEAGSGCDLPTRREADDAHTVGRNAPFGGVLTNVSNRSKAVSVGLRNDFTDDLPKLLPVCNQRREFLRRILASVHKAVLQNKRGDALRCQILDHDAAFTRDVEHNEAAA